MQPESNDVQVAGLTALVNKGARVLPLCHQGEINTNGDISKDGKDPAPGWGSWKTKAITVADIRDSRWAGRRWGIVPGSVKLCVIDFDKPDADPKALEWIESMAADRGIQIERLRTQQDGRLHLLFRCDLEIANNRPWRGGDVRGTNGYVVMWEGATAWIGATARLSGATPLPAEFLEKLQDSHKPRAKKQASTARTYSQKDPAEVDNLLMAVDDCPFDDCFRAIAAHLGNGGTLQVAMDWVNGHVHEDPIRSRHRSGWVQSIKPDGSLGIGTLVELGRRYPAPGARLTRTNVLTLPTPLVQAHEDLEAEEAAEKEAKIEAEETYETEFIAWKEAQAGLEVEDRQISEWETRIAMEHQYSQAQTQATMRFINSVQRACEAIMAMYGTDRTTTPFICIFDSKNPEWYRKVKHPNGGITWEKTTDVAVDNWIGDILRDILGEWKKDQAGNLIFIPWEEKAGGYYRASVRKELAKSAPFAHDIRDFDSKPYLIGLPDGWVLDVRNAKWRIDADMVWMDDGIREATEDDLITQRVSVMPKKPTPEEWRKSVSASFLRDFVSDDPERLYLQCYTGTMAIGAPAERKVLWIHGETNSGKTVFASHIRHLLGKSTDGGYSATLLPSVFMEKKRGATSGADVHTRNSSIASLVKVRGAIVSETGKPESYRIDKEMFKSLIGDGDELIGRFLQKDPFSFESRLNMIVVSNYQPAVDDFDPATFVRIVQLHVHATGRIDLKLRHTLRKPDEASWMMYWLLSGAVATWNMGLPPITPNMQALATDIKSDADPVGTFLEECCEITQSKADKIWLDELHEMYKRWDDETEMNSNANRKWFTARLREHGLQIKKARRAGEVVRCVECLRVK